MGATSCSSSRDFTTNWYSRHECFHRCFRRLKPVDFTAFGWIDFAMNPLGSQLIATKELLLVRASSTARSPESLSSSSSSNRDVCASGTNIYPFLPTWSPSIQWWNPASSLLFDLRPLDFDRRQVSLCRRRKWTCDRAKDGGPALQLRRHHGSLQQGLRIFPVRKFLTLNLR